MTDLPPGVSYSDLPPRPKALSTKVFFRALFDAGVLREDEAIKRIVIDADAGNVVMLYIERFGDDRLLNVMTTLEGVVIHQANPVVTGP